MLKSEGVATHMDLSATDEIAVLAGSLSKTIASNPLPIFSDLVCDFLSKLSSELLSAKEIKTNADVAAFAFWCRKSNISKMKLEDLAEGSRIGLGTALHIAPGNVPVNFAYSFAFALLAGNSNIVRVPSREYKQVDFILETIKKVSEANEYKVILDMNCFVRFSHDRKITEEILKYCQLRILWGGDSTIREMRMIQAPPYCREIVFPNRYSIAILSAAEICALSDVDLQKEVRKFYNDSYLFDQNACSSARLVAWIGDHAVINKAQVRFWDELYSVSMSKYQIDDVEFMNKYTDLCEFIATTKGLVEVQRHGNYIYRIKMDKNLLDVDTMANKYGTFIEVKALILDELKEIVSVKIQTVVYYGLNSAEILDFVFRNGLKGIDRIVPLGLALEMDKTWDGYDLPLTMSRKIDVK